MPSSSSSLHATSSASPLQRSASCSMRSPTTPTRSSLAATASSPYWPRIAVGASTTCATSSTGGQRPAPRGRGPRSRADAIAARRSPPRRRHPRRPTDSLTRVHAEIDVAELARLRRGWRCCARRCAPTRRVRGRSRVGSAADPPRRAARPRRRAPGVTPLYIICRSGSRRTAVAADFLAEQQIEAVNVAGGTLAWMRDGNDVVTGSNP